jgi:hypothetical protein
MSKRREEMREEKERKKKTFEFLITISSKKSQRDKSNDTKKDYQQ